MDEVEILRARLAALEKERQLQTSPGPAAGPTGPAPSLPPPSAPPMGAPPATNGPPPYLDDRHRAAQPQVRWPATLCMYVHLTGQLQLQSFGGVVIADQNTVMHDTVLAAEKRAGALAVHNQQAALQTQQAALQTQHVQHQQRVMAMKAQSELQVVSYQAQRINETLQKQNTVKRMEADCGAKMHFHLERQKGMLGCVSPQILIPLALLRLDLVLHVQGEAAALHPAQQLPVQQGQE